MKGIILAGGAGSRLGLSTKVTNKHLLPIYDKPMICYPLQTLISAGVKKIMIVSGKEHVGHISQFLGSGKDIGVEFTYRVQDEAGGIAQALGLAEDFAKGESIVVILGDNIFEENAMKFIQDFEKQGDGARIILKEVSFEDARRFGCAVTEGEKVIYVEEKPEYPRSNLAMTGLYFFDTKIFDIIKDLKPSGRGELEITDAIDYYVKTGKCRHSKIEGFWSDAGTPESLHKSAAFMKEKTCKS